MPDLSLSRQELLLMKQTNGISPRVMPDFQHDKQKLTMANSLFQAVVKGKINKVRHLLSRGVNINGKNDYGFSPLVAALHVEDDQKRSRMFKMLLDKGASYKVRDEQHNRPVLHWACVLGQWEQVKTLLEETAGDINLLEKDGHGFTALHHAVCIGSLPVADKLVEFHVRFGVSVDTADKLGLTPYLHARRLGYRDVATLLKDKGLASVGHGDNLFRSPREWSQIGKFERRKAIELQTQDHINAAKIMGKLGLAQIVENSPRMSIPGIVLPSYRPDQNGVSHRRKAPHHLSVSLPSLGEAAAEYSPERPQSTGQEASKDGNEVNNGDSSHRPGPPVDAFVEDTQATDSKSSIKSSAMGSQRVSCHDIKTNIANNSGQNSSQGSLASKMTYRSHNGLPLVTNQQPDNLSNGDHGILRRPQNVSHEREGRPLHKATFAAPVRTSSNLAALSLLEQSSFSKGRLNNHFHHSEFDKNKASEYKHMLGNLNSIMDVLSQQQTKSFRKSVEVRKPETPPKIKKKSKVSTWAIIFGDKKSAGKRKKSKSPSGSSARRKGGKDCGGKTDGKGGKSSAKGSSKQKSGTVESKPQGKMGRMNKLPVPTIKIN